MNKLILLILAVCLVSVHAYVKRDAPESPKPESPKPMDDLAESIKKSFQDAFNTISEHIDPEVIKKGFNDAFDSVKKAVGDIKPLEAPKA